MVIKVFLSCTSKDLEIYRNQVHSRCKVAGYEPVHMPEFGAQAWPGLETSLKEVAKCDYFVGIYAHRYGYIPPDYHQGVTEAEFWKAREREMPQFIFKYDLGLAEADEAIKSHQDCYDEHGNLTEMGKKMQAFLDQIAPLLTWKTFTTKEDLAFWVLHALSKYEGWRVLSVNADPKRKYIGREKLRQEIAETLSAQGRVAVVGGGGLGKTMTATQIGDELRSRYTGGVFWIELGESAKDPELAVLRAMQTWAIASHEGRIADPEKLEPQQFIHWMGQNPDPKLFIFDDIWHRRTAEALLKLLPADAHLLVTGRNTDMLGELGIMKTFYMEQMTEAEGLAMLRQRVGAIPKESALRDVVRAVDGHPLALEIAAAQILDYADENPDYADDLPALMAAELAEGKLFSLLEIPDEARKNSVIGIFALSYNRLSRDLQRRFRLLGAGMPDVTWSAEMLFALWGEEDPADAKSALQALQDRSLLRRREDGRYTLHRVLFFYARSLLQDDYPAARAIYEDLILKLTAKFDELPPQDWRENIEGESEHILALGDDFVRRVNAGEEATNAAQFAYNITRYLFRRREVQRLAWLEMGLKLAEKSGNRRREGFFRSQIGSVYLNIGKPLEALSEFERALAILIEVGDRGGEGATRHQMASVYLDIGKPLEALSEFERALAIRIEVGDRGGEAVTCYQMGMTYHTLGDLDKAIEYMERCVFLDEQVLHPDLESDRQMLNKLKAERDGTSNPQAEQEAAIQMLVSIYQQGGADALRAALQEMGLPAEQIEGLVAAIEGIVKGNS